MFTPRPYQIRMEDDIRNAYRKGYRAPLAVLPTGGGKTIVFSRIAAASCHKNKRVLILVHRVELLRQTAQKLRAFGVRVGLISPKYTPDFSAPIQVAMVQTMIKRLGKYPAFDLIITDEAHHAVSPTYLKILNNYPSAFQLGVTATPIRSDGKGLGDCSGGPFDSMVMGPSIQQLIDMGYLVEPVVYAPSKLDLSGVRTTRGKTKDYNRSDLEQVMDKPKIIGSSVKHYSDLCRGEPGVAFCVSVKHAEHVAAEFRAAGFRSYAVHGGTEDNAREKILKGLGDGSVNVVASCDVISEGTDIPAIACAMLLRPTQSTGLYLQQVGRALRIMEGKSQAIILDHVGNWMRHGMPTQDRDWSLMGETKKKKKREKEKAERVVQCLGCYAVFEPIHKLCPYCGLERKIKAREVEVVDGELQKISEAEIRRQKYQKIKERANAETLSDLKRIAEQRGYKPGWAEYVYRARKAKAAKNNN